MANLVDFFARAARFTTMACVVSALATSASAALIVNPARPITEKLQVQIIQTSLDDGSQPATIFGDASQRANIEADIDTIWAQAGIDIEFLPTTTPYANTFAFEGNGILLPRPTGDLNAMISNANNAGKLNAYAKVINMLFVEIVPGYNALTQFSAAGIANIDANGIAVFTGESLLGSAVNREVIAGVVAHEIGHNLGLTHTATGGANLMSPQRVSEQLTSQQIDTALSSSFLQSAGLGSDFSGDGFVNRADLNIWRSAFGVNGNGDADGDGDSDGRDFLIWQKQYGFAALAANQSVPEPSAILIVSAFGLLPCAGRRISSR